MPTNKERREIADKIRKMVEDRYSFTALNVADAIGVEEVIFDDRYAFSEACWLRLADLIEPDENIVHCRECVHFRPENEQKQTPSRCTGVFAFVEPSDEGFCAWGKKVDINCTE